MISDINDSNLLFQEFSVVRNIAIIISLGHQLPIRKN